MVRDNNIERRKGFGRREALGLCAGVASVGLAGYVGRSESRTSEEGFGVQGSLFTGVRHKAIGNAELRKTDEGLRVELPERDRGGIRMLLGNVEGFVSNWEPLETRELPDGATLKASANGVVRREDRDGGGNRRWLGSTSAVKEGRQVGILADYRPLESEAQLLVVLRDGERVRSVEQHEGRLKAVVPQIPDGCGKIPPRFPRPWPLCYIWDWRNPVPMEIPEVGTVEGDEIRVLAADSPFGLQSLNQFDVRMQALSGLTVESESIRYGPS